jgi:hypothetical protein
MSSKAAYDDVNTSTLGLMTIYAVIITFISIVGCQVIYFAMQQRQEERKQLRTEHTLANQFLVAQREKLALAGEEEREEGDKKIKYRLIPIEQAMEQVVKEKNAETRPSKNHDQT